MPMQLRLFSHPQPLLEFSHNAYSLPYQLHTSSQVPYPEELLELELEDEVLDVDVLDDDELEELDDEVPPNAEQSGSLKLVLAWP